jgi:hypothetical protein
MKRTLLYGSAWAASAAAAVGLGFLAVSLVDASAATPLPALDSSVTTLSAGGPSPAPPTSSLPSPATDSPAPVAAGQQVTAGGTVYGSCADGVPVLASAPAAGWSLDDSNDAGRVEFGNGAQKIEVRVSCVGGVAQFSVEGPRAEDSGGGSGSGARSGNPVDHSSSTAPVPAAGTASSVDDSAGRTGGGHGADDGIGSAPSAPAPEPGDDSGGHGGGHGSDG